MLKHVGRLDAAASVGGALLVVTAIALVWFARGSVTRDVYVSELGAQGMSTSRVFLSALLCLVVGGVLIAWAARRIRAEPPILRWWRPSVSLWISSGLFLLASQVTCTYGCPAPIGPAFTWQDLVHTIAAVLAFAFACVAMLQVAVSRRHQVITTMSAICAWSVAALAGIGGVLGIFRVSVDIGASLEFFAMTIAALWIVALGGAITAEAIRVSRTRLLRTA